MSDQDWTPVVLSKTNKQKTAGMNSAQVISRARMVGAVSTEKKFGKTYLNRLLLCKFTFWCCKGAAENKAAPTANMKKLEDSTDEFKHKVVDQDLSKAITQARLAKKLTQADLAKAINERPQIIQEYESGRAIPNPQILLKLDRALGIHLPRGKK